jgi:hypothetical protein
LHQQQQQHLLQHENSTDKPTNDHHGNLVEAVRGIQPDGLHQSLKINVGDVVDHGQHENGVPSLDYNKNTDRKHQRRDEVTQQISLNNHINDQSEKPV